MPKFIILVSVDKVASPGDARALLCEKIYDNAQGRIAVSDNVITLEDGQTITVLPGRHPDGPPTS